MTDIDVTDLALGWRAQPTNDELHDLVSGLALFPYMDIQLTPVARHLSDIETLA
jgi:muconolactone delta-isomerase